jgi:hypothetical protein
MFCLLTGVVVVAVVGVLAQSLLRDPDNWWHVKVGLDMLDSHALPTVDIYSHTFAGHAWIAKEWLGQILFALSYNAAGWNGVVALVAATVALTAFLMAWYLSAWLKPTLALALALAMTMLISPVFTARPHIFTLPIIVVWTAHLFAAAREERAPPFWLLGLLCLWANLHATFTFGFVIAAFAGLDFLVRARFSRPGRLAGWIAFGLLCPLVSLINPYGIKAILATFTVAYGNEAVPYINEWRPFAASVDHVQAAALLLATLGLLVSGFRIGWTNALFVIFALYVYMSHTRFVYLFFLLVPIVLAFELARQFPALSFKTWKDQERDGLERLFGNRFWQICGIGAVALAGVSMFANSAGRISPSAKTSASGAIDYAKTQSLPGNVLNSYNFGGTLIFHGIKTYIDGRTDQLFLGGFTKTDDDLGRSGGKPILREQIVKHAIAWALLTTDDPRIPFFKELGWRQTYADAHAVIYQPPVE